MRLSRLILCALTVHVGFLGLMTAHAAPPPMAPPAAAPPHLTADFVRPKIAGYWKEEVREEDIRQHYMAMAKDNFSLFINGQYVTNPTDAQRKQFVKEAEAKISEELKNRQSVANNMIIRVGADGTMQSFIKEL